MTPKVILALAMSLRREEFKLIIPTIRLNKLRGMPIMGMIQAIKLITPMITAVRAVISSAGICWEL